MKTTIGFITGFAGLLGIIGSFISIRFWLITIIIMSILKLTGLLVIPWFTSIFAAGAISTGLWMLFGGLILMGISFLIGVASVALLDK